MVGAIAVVAGPRGWIAWQVSAARQELASGRPQAAAERMQRLVQFFPASSAAQYRLAVAQRRAGHLDQVGPSLKTAQKLGWEKQDIERQTLLLIAQSGEIDAVETRLKSIMARGASDEAAEEIYEALAIGYLKTYRLKDAWECLNFWSEWQPKAIFPRVWRADICRRIDNPTAEEEEYREILAIDPRRLETRCRLAEVLKDSNRIEEAAKEFEACLKQDSQRPEVLIGLAECRRRMGTDADVLGLLEQALALNLNSAQRCAALTQWGQIDADAGRWTDAVRRLEEAARLAPYEPSTLFSLSQAYSSAGEQQKSLDVLERSKHVRDQKNRIEEIVRSLVDQPGSADLRYEAGKIMMDLGMKDDGAAWLRTALVMQPDHKAAREALEAHLEGASPASATPPTGR